MTLTEAEKLAFGEWMETTLTANTETITQAKPDIPFAVEGYTKTLAEKHGKLKEAEGQLARLKQEKHKQTEIANDTLTNLRMHWLVILVKTTHFPNSFGISGVL